MQQQDEPKTQERDQDQKIQMANTEQREMTATEMKWLDESHVDPVWIQEHIGIIACKSCVAQDISNQMRKGTRVRDGATLRLSVELNNGKSTTFIVKQVATPEGRQLSQNLGLSREALFYKYMAPQITATEADVDDDEVQKQKEEDTAILPKIYYSRGIFDKGSKLIVMEVLHNFVDSGIFFGPGNPNNWTRNLPQLIQQAMVVPVGASGVPPPPPTPGHVARVTFEHMARIHALYWKQSSLLDPQYKWLRGQEWVQSLNQPSWQASQQILQKSWNAYLATEQQHQQVVLAPESKDDNNDNDDSNKLIQWDPIVRQAVEKAIDGISWEAQIQRLNENQHWTLVHGDFWPGNILWKKGVSACNSNQQPSSSPDSLRLVDWEMVGLGSGPQELGQYVISNMSRSDRQECEESLVRHYYDTLTKSASSSSRTLMTWDDCWKEYTVGGIERWLWFLIYFLGNPNMTSWAQFFHNQMSDFMADHQLTAQDITQPRP